MTYDENEEYNGPDIHRRGPFLFMAAIVGVIVVAGFGAAVSDAKADEQPFTVTAEGVSLPAGQTFPDGGHVNIQATAPHNDLHFEAKCIDRVDAECANLHDAAQFIGQPFIPWSAFGLTDGCVSWVQVAGINKHFGDAGEEPICLGGTPSTTPAATEPASPLPTPTATTEPSPSPTPTSSPTSTPEPSSNASLGVNTGSGGLTLTAPESTSTDVPARLADTGRPVTIWGLGLLMSATLAIGLGLLTIVRRSNP
jgi:hypothetical protein